MSGVRNRGSGVRNRRRWGWNRLDPQWAQRVVDAAEIRPGDLVVELGAGTGALTGPLLETGARVLAVELHHARAAQLRRRFSDRDLTVVEADLREVRLPRSPFSVVASPPYAVSTDLLRRLLSKHTALRRADLVLQRQVVNRYVAGRSHGNEVWRRRFDAALGLRLPRKAFTPVPVVDSAVLQLRRRRTG